VRILLVFDGAYVVIRDARKLVAEPEWNCHISKMLDSFVSNFIIEAIEDIQRLKKCINALNGDGIHERARS